MATFGLIEYKDASPEVREVYDDIMATRKTDYINNFWKALAAHPVTPVDTTGAVDAFIGSLATFLAGGCPENDAIERANVYAALSSLDVGTQRSFVTRERFDEEWGKRGK